MKNLWLITQLLIINGICYLRQSEIIINKDGTIHLYVRVCGCYKGFFLCLILTVLK